VSFFIALDGIFTLIFFFDYALLLVSTLRSRPLITPYLLPLTTSSHPFSSTRLLRPLELSQIVTLTRSIGKSPELKWWSTLLADGVRDCRRGTLTVGSCSS
jgi:hypothetical protein